MDKGDIKMAIELLREYDLDGVTQDCVKWDCSCGSARIIPFQKVKSRERTQCPECGCVRSFSTVIIEQFENELKEK
jgi:hypothetical protein